MFGTVSSRRRRALALTAALTCLSSACAPIGGVPSAADTTTFRPARATTTTPSAPAVHADFPEVFLAVASAVLPITALTCDSRGTGSGFLADPRTVVTAAHVVDGTAVVVVQVEGVPVNAVVLGADTTLDVALLEIGRDAVAKPLELAESDPTVGEDVAAIGYPGGDPLRMTEGLVTDTGKDILANGTRLTGLVETDVPVRPGNSGGPLVNGMGHVLGVVVAGALDADVPSYAVPVSTIRSRVDNPGLLPRPGSPPCELPLGPEERAITSLAGLETLNPDLRATFETYFGGINMGDYARAYGQLSPRIQARLSFADFARAVSTSFDFGFAVDYVAPAANPLVGLSFTSIQDPAYGPDGQPCTRWFLEYHLIPTGGGGFLIDRADERLREPCG